MLKRGPHVSSAPFGERSYPSAVLMSLVVAALSARRAPGASAAITSEGSLATAERTSQSVQVHALCADPPSASCRLLETDSLWLRRAWEVLRRPEPCPHETLAMVGILLWGARAPMSLGATETVGENLSFAELGLLPDIGVVPLTA